MVLLLIVHLLLGFRRLREIEGRLGYRFKDPALLETALTHRSHAHEQRGERPTNYERLEYLGDATLGFLVSEWLYRDDEAATAVEYAVLLALILMGVIGAIQLFGGEAGNLWSGIDADLGDTEFGGSGGS